MILYSVIHIAMAFKRKIGCVRAQVFACLTRIASVGMNSTEQCVFATKSASTPYVPAHLLSPMTLLLPIESLPNSCQEEIKLKVWSQRPAGKNMKNIWATIPLDLFRSFRSVHRQFHIDLKHPVHNIVPTEQISNSELFLHKTISLRSSF